MVKIKDKLKKILKIIVLTLISLIVLLSVVIPIGIKISDKISEVVLSYRIKHAKYGTFIPLGNEPKVEATQNLQCFLLSNDNVFITDGTYIELFNNKTGKYMPIIPNPKFNWLNNSIISYFNYFISIKYTDINSFNFYQLNDGRILLYRYTNSANSLVYNSENNSFEYTKLPAKLTVTNGEKLDEKLIKTIGLPKDYICKLINPPFLVNYTSIDKDNILIVEFQNLRILDFINKNSNILNNKIKVIVKIYNKKQDKITEKYEYSFDNFSKSVLYYMIPQIYKISNSKFVIFAYNRLFEYNSAKKTLVVKAKLLKDRNAKSTKYKDKIFIYGGTSYFNTKYKIHQVNPKEIEEYDVKTGKISIVGNFDNGADLYCTDSIGKFYRCYFYDNYTRDIVDGDKIILIRSKGKSEVFNLSTKQKSYIQNLDNLYNKYTPPFKRLYKVVKIKSGILVTAGTLGVVSPIQRTELLILDKGVK